MDSNLRNADSGLDLDDSGSGGDTLPGRGGGGHTTRGKNMRLFGDLAVLYRNKGGFE